MKTKSNKNPNRKIPNNLNDCVTPDETSTLLRIWAERVEAFGKIIFYILIAVAILDTCSVAFQIYVSETFVNYFIGSEPSDFIALPVIKAFCKNIILVFLEYCIYSISKVLLTAVADIVENSHITTNLALFKNGINGEKFNIQAKNTHQKPVAEKQHIVPAETTEESEEIIFEEIIFKDIMCPHCKTELSFPNNLTVAECPNCDTEIIMFPIDDIK